MSLRHTESSIKEKFQTPQAPDLLQKIEALTRDTTGLRRKRIEYKDTQAIPLRENPIPRTILQRGAENKEE